MPKPTGKNSAAARARETAKAIVPRSDEEMRLAVLAHLVPALVAVTGKWRGCKPGCRRRRTCAYPQNCTRLQPREAFTPEQEAAALAQLRRELKRHIAQRRAEEAE